MSQAISFEREASPTANTNNAGQVSYYDYVGKGPSDTWKLGTDSRLALSTRLLPDNSTWYQTVDFYNSGPPTTLTSTYSLPQGGTNTRSRGWTYEPVTGTEKCVENGTNDLGEASWTYFRLTSASGPESETLLSLSGSGFTTNTTVRSSSGSNYTFTTILPRRLQLGVTDAVGNQATVFHNSKEQVTGIRWPHLGTSTNFYGPTIS